MKSACSACWGNAGPRSEAIFGALSQCTCCVVLLEGAETSEGHERRPGAPEGERGHHLSLKALGTRGVLPGGAHRAAVPRGGGGPGRGAGELGGERSPSSSCRWGGPQTAVTEVSQPPRQREVPPVQPQPAWSADAARSQSRMRLSVTARPVTERVSVRSAQGTKEADFKPFCRVRRKSVTLTQWRGSPVKVVWTGSPVKVVWTD